MRGSDPRKLLAWLEKQAKKRLKTALGADFCTLNSRPCEAAPEKCAPVLV
jgi:hypothetical protein